MTARAPTSDEDDGDDEWPTRLQTAAFAFFAAAVLLSYVAVPVLDGDPGSEVLPTATLGTLLVATFGSRWLEPVVPRNLATRFEPAAWLDWCVAVAATAAGAGYRYLGWSEWTAWVLVGTGALLGVVLGYADLDAHWLHVVAALAAGVFAFATVFGVVARGAGARWLVLGGVASLAIAADQLVLRRRVLR